MKRDIKEIIDGLQFTVEMFLFDPSTGETRNDSQLNEEDMITVNACRKAIAYIKEKEAGSDENTSDPADTDAGVKDGCTKAKVEKVKSVVLGTDLLTLADGTEFYVVNGDWTGRTFSIDDKKFIHVNETGMDFPLTAEYAASIMVKIRKKR